MTNKPDTAKTKARRPKVTPQQNVPSLNLIGVFVLAAGLAAFIAVLYLGYVRYINNAEPINAGQSEQSSGPLAIEEGNIAGAQANRSELRLSKASLRQMQGSWGTKYGAITASLVLDGANGFDLVLYMDAIGYERLVAKGEYSYDEKNGIMRLQPSYDPPPTIEGAKIAPLTYRPYNIIVLRKAGDGNILWVPHIKEGHRDQVHPIFVRMAVKDEYIEWRPQR